MVVKDDLRGSFRGTFAVKSLAEPVDGNFGTLSVLAASMLALPRGGGSGRISHTGFLVLSAVHAAFNNKNIVKK